MRSMRPGAPEDVQLVLEALKHVVFESVRRVLWSSDWHAPHLHLFAAVRDIEAYLTKHIEERH